MKKVLILTASTGDGHNQAADSLADVFAANGYRAIKFDFLKRSSQLWNTLVVGGYKLLAFKFPKVYGSLYRLSDFKGFNNIIPGILINSIEEGVLNEINRHNPDVIIGTHAFAVTVVSKLKKRNLIDMPFVSIVTDFKAHGSYIGDGVDAYITGCEYTSLNMIERNVHRSKVFPFGIPIRRAFLCDKPLKNRLSDECFTILLMSGGMGLNFIAPVLKRLMGNEHKLKIIVVCGNNKSLKETLEKQYSKNISNKEVHILGFTNNVSEILDEADVIITKPGGLTISEAITKRVPMLLPYAIPGQEKENMTFLFSTGAAIDVRKLHNFNDVLNNLIEHPEELDKMRKSLDKIFKDYSTESIVELSNSLIKNNRGFKYVNSSIIEAVR
jgi:processive 1,2-diacylglycerol beta-glucosyltransferase